MHTEQASPPGFLRVKEVATAQGVSMSQLAQQSNVSYSTVRAIWHNSRHGALLSTVEKLARALRVPTKQLVQ